VSRNLLRLFDPNPPNDEQLALDVFVDRDRELKLLARRLEPPASTDKICAVHGGSRTGKSHLLRVLLASGHLLYDVAECNANSLGSARVVLQTLYGELRRKLEQVSDPRDLAPEGVSPAGVVAEVLWFYDQVDRVLVDEQTSMTVRLSESVRAAQAWKLLAKAMGLQGEVAETVGSVSEYEVATPKHALCPRGHAVGSARTGGGQADARLRRRRGSSRGGARIPVG